MTTLHHAMPYLCIPFVLTATGYGVLPCENDCFIRHPQCLELGQSNVELRFSLLQIDLVPERMVCDEPGAPLVSLEVTFLRPLVFECLVAVAPSTLPTLDLFGNQRLALGLDGTFARLGHAVCVMLGNLTLSNVGLAI